MKRYKESYTDREIRDLLTSGEVPRPPAGLAELIKSEIPDTFDRPQPVAEAKKTNVIPFLRRPSARTYLMAASLVVTLGGAFFAYRVHQQMVSPDNLILATQEAMSTSEAVASETVASETVASETVASEAVASETVASELIASDAMAFEPTGPEYALADHTDLTRSPPTSDAQPLPEVSKEIVESLQALGYVNDVPKNDLPKNDVPKPKAKKVELQTPPPPQIQAVPPAPVPSPSTGPRLERRARFRQSRGALEARSGSPSKLDEAQAFAESRQSNFEPNAMASRQLTTLTFGIPEPAIPNQAPFDNVYFRNYGTNPFIDTEDDALSTFSLDVDTASYTVMRRYLSDGHLPPSEAVRVEELINYFDYGDAPPIEGDFAIHAEGAPSIFGEGERYHLLRFHVRGREMEPRERKPANLTFVIDISGSMAQENRLGLVRESLTLLTDHLREDDRVGIVVYGSRGRVVLEHTSDHNRIRRALNELSTEGSTNAEEGLRLGYDLAARGQKEGTINRVILCSDGVANVGQTSAESILQLVGDISRRGVELTTVGFGMGNYNDVLMEQLADRGNGRYAYVDSLEESRRLFVEDLTGTLQTIAAEARAQIHFNPEVVSRYRLVGYENRNIADERFRDDTVDAGEIGAGHAVTALYEIKLRDTGSLKSDAEIATFRLRYGSILSGEMVEAVQTVRGRDMAETWQGSSPALRLTTLVAEFGEIMKQSFWAQSGSFDEVFRRAQVVGSEFPGRYEVAELVVLIGKAAQIQR